MVYSENHHKDIRRKSGGTDGYWCSRNAAPVAGQRTDRPKVNAAFVRLVSGVAWLQECRDWESCQQLWWTPYPVIPVNWVGEKPASRNTVERQLPEQTRSPIPSWDTYGGRGLVCSGGVYPPKTLKAKILKDGIAMPFSARPESSQATFD